MEGLKLHSELVLLRPLEPTDLAFLRQVENNPEFWTISQTVQPFSDYTLSQYIEQAHQNIFEAKQQRWVICDAKTENRIGFIDLFDFDARNSRVGLGIVIAASSSRGKGYGSEALSLIINYVFQHLNLHQIYVNILIENEVSMQLFSKFGFKLSGVKKAWIREGNQFKDEALYQLIDKKR
ncbi:MAG TPA: GNAT family N-acetyltransferase [Flavobacterium sp.]|nr:GNAT family N-acetyltransferase [Flavobacterium sp.]